MLLNKGADTVNAYLYVIILESICKKNPLEKVFFEKKKNVPPTQMFESTVLIAKADSLAMIFMYCFSVLLLRGECERVLSAIE